MSDTGWLLPTVDAIDLGDTSKSSWTVLDEVKAIDDVGTQSSGGGVNEDTDTLKTYTYNAAVPAGATIDGFEVRMRLYSPSDVSADNTIDSVEVGLDDSTLGTAKTPGTLITILSWLDYDIGSSTDLWGHTTPSVAAVNASTFQVRSKYHRSSSVHADHVSVKIYYTVNEPTTPGPSVIPRPRNSFPEYSIDFSAMPDSTDTNLIETWRKIVGGSTIATDTTYGLSAALSSHVSLRERKLPQLSMWADIKIIALLDAAGGFTASGVIVRAGDSGSSYDGYVARFNGQSANINFEKYIDGSFQWGENYSHTPAIGDVLRIEAHTLSGAVLLKVFLNGQQIAERVDSTEILTHPYTGFYIYGADSSRCIGVSPYRSGIIKKKPIYIGKPKDQRVVVF